MITKIASPASELSVEDALREDLRHSDAQLSSIVPIMRHLLANDEHSVFSDEIIARVRGMAEDIAQQLLDAVAAVDLTANGHANEPAQIGVLVREIFSNPAFLTHCHALAMEWHLTERMQARIGVDPVLSPLLQSLIASAEPSTAATAMALLAAQARFSQSQRRMQLPLAELPGDLLHVALLALRSQAKSDPVMASRIAAAESAIRSRFDESRSRLGLIARIVAAMGGGAMAALSVSHAGAAIFLSALSLASGHDRDLTIMATNEGQFSRLALAMRAAGLKPAQIEEQFAALHPDVDFPISFDQLGADRAAALLANAFTFAGR